jgi:hypothetical protein
MQYIVSVHQYGYAINVMVTTAVALKVGLTWMPCRRLLLPPSHGVSRRLPQSVTSTPAITLDYNDERRKCWYLLSIS